MGTSKAFSGQPSSRDAQRRWIWIALLVSSGIGLSLVFACATPFAAVATLAALKLERRDAVAVVGLVWLVNQAIGYGILGYPWTLDSVAWGGAIGLSGFLALLVAAAFSSTRPVRLAIGLPFVGAFAAFELALYVAGFALPGGQGGFTAAIVEKVFLVNLVTLVGLLAVYQVALMAGLLTRQSASRGMVSVPR
jgi:hypothetical protein